MRNIVEHGHTSGSSDTIVLSGCSSAMRCTMWISVPTPMTAPAGAASTHSRMRSVRADPVGELDDLVRALGVHDHLAVGVLGAELGDVLGAEALVHGALAPPQQERRFLDVALLEAAELVARVPDPHVGLAVAHVVAGVAAEVLVGEEQAPCRRRAEAPTRGRPARSTTCTPRRRARRRTPSAPPRSSCT